MTIELIEQEIRRFLESATAEVICLRGKWGVGKTYSWNYFLDKAKERNKIALPAYSYVSLFGINTLEELKIAILANSVLVQSTSASGNSLNEIWNRWWRRGLGAGAAVTQEIPFIKEYVGKLPALSFHLVRETVVCIDDLERKGKDLKARDVLGLISDLRERKQCKVMLILNEEQIADDDKKDFSDHNEKVIDASLEFSPTAAECVFIALQEKTEANSLLSENCTKLGISNIRIIKKVERLVARANEMLAGFDKQILIQVAHTLTLLTWAKFSQDGPTVEFIRDKANPYRAFLNEDQKLSEQEERWTSVINDYGFRGFDEFDAVLLEGVERGFFNEQKMRGLASVIQRSIEANQSEKAFSDAWNLYHTSFDDNLGEVINEIERAFNQCIQYVSPLNLDGTVGLFKELGYGERTKKMIADYVAIRSGNKNFFDFSSHPLLQRIQDEDIRTAFQDAFSAIPDTRSPLTVLEDLGGRNGWNREDVDLLKTLSEEDFYKLFKSHSGDALSNIIRASLRFRSTPEAAEISERAEKALKKIGQENLLNKLRVKGYGIDVG